MASQTRPSDPSEPTAAEPTPAELSARAVALFDRVADTYDNVGVPWFTPIAAGLVRAVAPPAGVRVLDVGCGRGAATFPLAEAVGPTGHVTGIDLAARMVEATRADVTARGLTNVDLRLMDASAPTLPPSSYQIVVASLVLFFMPDPDAALRAWRDLLVPAGLLGIATFGVRDPRWIALDAMFRPYLPPRMLDARTTGASGPFSSDEGVANLLTQAGFTGVRTTGHELSVAFTDPDQWYAWSQSHGQRGMWDAVPEAERASLRAATAGHLEACRGTDGRITLTQQIRYTLGTRTL